MADINVNKIVGDTFEDMSIVEMTLVQGSGDVSGEFTTSPACVYVSVAASKASSQKCAGAASAIASAVSGAVVSAVKC
ncbi:lichenicidin A2 family type 2 lantibiotic [Clostridium sporogenes]|uniref:lichenicidin A2 family type 2 lantibiotic n=1 Tax=Clostridium botulinum TaxID=1491 RepID=UPI000D12CA84|nr:lichenicidin A2 family type 2 lantibiotic [Clostridium botulinum]AVQ44939.1 type 2 lantibiotic [Clostridium botulinum]AVQ49010.1 type 2 lantibiotic [Clostridium botulinum]